MRAWLPRDARNAFVGEREAIELCFDYVVFVREKINVAVRFIDRGMAGGARTEAARAGNGPIAIG